MSIEFKEEHLREITENSERSKSNCHRIDEIEEDIKSLKEDNRALYEMSASIKTLTDFRFNPRNYQNSHNSCN